MVSTVTDRLQGFSIGAAVKSPSYVASTANITLSGAQTIDGISVGSCQRVLVKAQDDAKENGIYISDSSTWIRAADADGNRDIKPGTLIYVDRGTQFGQTFWVANSSSTAIDVVIGTDNIVLSQVTLALAGVSAFGSTFVTAVNEASARDLLGLSTNTLAASTAVSSSQINDNVVTLSKMSTGTVNAVIAYSSTGEFVEVVSSSSGLVLTSNATDVKPSWQPTGGAAAPAGYQNGILISNSTVDASHDVAFSPGIVRGQDDVSNIVVASSFYKQLDSTYAEGDNAGGLAGSTLAADTWYNCFVLDVGGTQDAGFDTSNEATNLTVAASATDYRLRGSVLTDAAANILPFVQLPNGKFVWRQPVQDVLADTMTGQVPETYQLTVPTGRRVLAEFGFSAENNDNSGPVVSVYTPDLMDSTIVAVSTNFLITGENTGGSEGADASGQLHIWTDTTASVTVQANISIEALNINTRGWFDPRGQE